MQKNDKIVDLLEFWHKIEFFAPYKSNENENFYRINNETDLPWNHSCHDVKCIDECIHKRVFYVYLGIFQLRDTIKVIENKLGDKIYGSDEIDSESCICKFKINSDLEYETNSFRISSLPWSVNKVVKGELYPSSWSNEFEDFERYILSKVENHTTKWDFTSFNNLMNEILYYFDWKIDLSTPWLVIEEFKTEKRKSKNDITDNDKVNTSNQSIDETEKQDEMLLNELELDDVDEEDEAYKKNDLLNSFYARDIEHVIDSVKIGEYARGFEAYVSQEVKEKDRRDNENDIEIIKLQTSPDKIPLGRWPSNNNLSLMQQIAVNMSRSAYIESERIFSINGPPGTGKTTLLNDIIASIIVDRAILISDLAKPDDAFVTEKEIQTKSGFRLKLSSLKNELKDFGIVIASNNNAAVTNITKEMPSIEAIPKYYSEKFNYFAEQAEYITDKKSWGLICSVLGNTKNVKEFVNKFWDISRDEENKSIKWLLCNYKGEKPNWKDSVKVFKEKLQLVKNHKEKLISCYDMIMKVQINNSEINDNLQQIEDYNKKQIIENNSKNELETSRSLIAEEIADASLQLCSIDETVFQKILNIFNKSNPKKHELKQKLVSLRHKYTENDVNILNVNKEIENIAVSINTIQERNVFLQNENDNLSNLISNIEKEEELEFLHKNYWTDFNKSEKAQMTSPWITDKFNKLREELFLEAMNLHKAFILNSEKIKPNLNIFFNMMRKNIEEKTLTENAADIFDSFFLVVPVMSTTFASLSRLFRHIGSEQIPWLLIDEAGQATPQSAVGGIWRAKRTIVVGDPLQIAPVVTTPQSIFDRFNKEYNIDTMYKRKDLSVQKLADNINIFGTYRELDNYKLWVGSPLRVHRRCLKDIFDISNSIAYNGKMIYRTDDPKNEDNLITKSEWVSISGSTLSGHYVKEQGKYIFEQTVILLQKYIENNCFDRFSLFIISPFRTVKEELVKLFKEELFKTLKKDYPEVSKKWVDTWIKSNIGTIHTFQGKQADNVILCLGIDSKNPNRGAIQWVCNRPNIINVAVSRAKYRLIVVGDFNVWRNERYALEIYKCIQNEI